MAHATLLVSVNSINQIVNRHLKTIIDSKQYPLTAECALTGSHSSLTEGQFYKTTFHARQNRFSTVIDMELP